MKRGELQPDDGEVAVRLMANPEDRAPAIIRHYSMMFGFAQAALKLQMYAKGKLTAEQKVSVAAEIRNLGRQIARCAKHDLGVDLWPTR